MKLRHGVGQLPKEEKGAGSEKLKDTERNLAAREQTMLGTVLIVILILALLGALPRWSHSREWGYVPTGGVGVALVVVVALVLLGRL
jgi:hypothetical protein